MQIDSATLYAALVAVTSLAGWGVTQLNARSKAQRAEVKELRVENAALRRQDLLRLKHQYRLTAKLVSNGITPPEPPDGLDEDLEVDL